MKKATGIDSISTRIVTLSHKQILNPVTNIVNFCLSQKVFPYRMKMNKKKGIREIIDLLVFYLHRQRFMKG